MFLILITTILVSASDLSTPSPEQVIQKGFGFISQHQKDTQFEVKEAESLVDALIEIGTNSRLAKGLRSNAYIAVAKISWRIADKYRMKGGVEYGRRAIEAIKEALDIDASNKDAALSYAKTISDMTEQGYAIRKILTSKLAISLEREAESALEHLKRLRLTSSTYYQILKQYLD